MRTVRMRRRYRRGSVRQASRASRWSTGETVQPPIRTTIAATPACAARVRGSGRFARRCRIERAGTMAFDGILIGVAAAGVLVALYAYVGFPAIAALLGAASPRHRALVDRRAQPRKVTVIVSAY